MSFQPIQVDRMAAVPMFVAAAAFSAALSGVIHTFEVLPEVAGWCGCGLIVLYPIFWLEAGYHWYRGTKNHRQHWLHSIFPPFRLVVWDHGAGTHIWLPVLGWRRGDPALYRFISRALAPPVIIVALLTVPLIGVEYAWKDEILHNGWLQAGVCGTTAIIWLAFLCEFVVLFTLTKRKWDYCRENWLDLVILLLPLIAFLRAARLGRVLRLQQLARSARVFRLRGAALKVYRTLLCLDILDRLLRRDPAKQLAHLQTQLANKEEELADLRRRIEALQCTTEAQDSDTSLRGSLNDTALD